MKKVSVTTIHLGKWTQAILDIRSASAWGLMLALCTLGFFLLTAVAAIAQSAWFSTPPGSIKGLAAAVPSQFFADMLALEMQRGDQGQAESTFSGRNISKFAFSFVTGVKPWDPKSLLAAEVPIMTDQTYILRSALGTDLSSPPVDLTPSKDALGGNDASASAASGDSQQNDPQPASPASDSSGNGSGSGANSGSDSGSSAAPSEPAMTTGGRKVVFIYHTHNRESYLPELKSKGITDPDNAYDPKINVTLLGKRLAQKLEAQGIGAVDSSTDYVTAVKDFNYNYSYKYSLQTLKEATAMNRNYTYFFDIHRDSGSRKETTVTLNGKAYAQVFFIIGQRNPNWEKNEAFASEIHEKLEKLYPGLSKGLWGKGPSSGNAEYNQSVSPKDILIEVGGPENTLEECYRTIDALAKVIGDLYWDAEKVNASASGGDTPKS